MGCSSSVLPAKAQRLKMVDKQVQTERNQEFHRESPLLGMENDFEAPNPSKTLVKRLKENPEEVPLNKPIGSMELSVISPEKGLSFKSKQMPNLIHIFSMAGDSLSKNENKPMHSESFRIRSKKSSLISSRKDVHTPKEICKKDSYKIVNISIANKDNTNHGETGRETKQTINQKLKKPFKVEPVDLHRSLRSARVSNPPEMSMMMNTSLEKIRKLRGKMNSKGLIKVLSKQPNARQVLGIPEFKIERKISPNILDQISRMTNPDEIKKAGSNNESLGNAHFQNQNDTHMMLHEIEDLNNESIMPKLVKRDQASLSMIVYKESRNKARDTENGGKKSNILDQSILNYSLVKNRKRRMIPNLFSRFHESQGLSEKIIKKNKSGKILNFNMHLMSMNDNFHRNLDQQGLNLEKRKEHIGLKPNPEKKLDLQNSLQILGGLKENGASPEGNMINENTINHNIIEESLDTDSYDSCEISPVINQRMLPNCQLNTENTRIIPTSFQILLNGQKHREVNPPIIREDELQVTKHPRTKKGETRMELPVKLDSDSRVDQKESSSTRGNMGSPVFNRKFIDIPVESEDRDRIYYQFQKAAPRKVSSIEEMANRSIEKTLMKESDSISIEDEKREDFLAEKMIEGKVEVPDIHNPNYEDIHHDYEDGK